MAEVKWVKIVTDIFDDEKILLIESLPEADSIIVIWFKLLCLAGKQNNSGVFTINGRIPYTDEMFATIFRRPLNTVRLALKTFEDFGMIEIVNHTVTIPNWGKHQNIEQLEARREYQRLYHQEYRKRQKQLTSGCEAEQPDSVEEQKVEADDGECLRKCLRQDGRTHDVNALDKNRIDKNNIEYMCENAHIPPHIPPQEDAEDAKVVKRKRFIPPTVEDIREFAKEKGYTLQEINPEMFISFYESKGWKVGKDPMKSWKSAVSGWVLRERQKRGVSQAGNVRSPGGYNDPSRIPCY